MSQHLKTLQDTVATELTAASALANVPIVPFYAGNLDNLIERHSSGADGLLVVVLPPLPAHAADAPGVVFESVSLDVRLLAHLHVKDTLPTLMNLAEDISALLQDWNPALTHWHSPLRLRGNQPWTLTLAARPPQPHQLDIHFTLFGNLTPTA